MTQRPAPKGVALAGDYSHVRFRDPAEFAEIRTPAWATAAAASVFQGTTVRTGRRSGGDDWVVQSALNSTSAARADAVWIVETFDG